MSEEYDTEFDIDRAFADLLEDVGGRTAPPPASTIVERARRRRTTTFAAAAAVVLIVGAAAVASGVGRPSAAPGPAGQLPAPHVLDRDAWAAATEGWVTGWEPITGDSSLAWLDKLQDPKCLGAMPDTGPEPDRSGALTLVSGSHEVVFGAFADFDDPAKAQTTWRQLFGAVGDCPEATLLHQGTWDGAEAQSYRLAGSGGSDYVWVARQGQSMGLIWVAGDAEPLPDSTDTRVMTTLVAGLQEPDTFKGRDNVTTDTGSASASGSVAAVPNTSVLDGDFAQALGSWDSGWERRGSKVASASLPCLSVDTAPNSTGGFGTSLGGNGDYSVSSFTDDASAASAYDSALNVLRSCPETYSVRTTGTSPQVTVASSSSGVAWLVRNGSNIGVISVHDGHANPPAEVSAAVGDLIDRALRTTSP